MNKDTFKELNFEEKLDLLVKNPRSARFTNDINLLKEAIRINIRVTKFAENDELNNFAIDIYDHEKERTILHHISSPVSHDILINSLEANINNINSIFIHEINEKLVKRFNISKCKGVLKSLDRSSYMFICLFIVLGGNIEDIKSKCNQSVINQINEEFYNSDGSLDMLFIESVAY